MQLAGVQGNFMNCIQIGQVLFHLCKFHDARRICRIAMFREQDREPSIQNGQKKYGEYGATTQEMLPWCSEREQMFPRLFHKHDKVDLETILAKGSTYLQDCRES